MIEHSKSFIWKAAWFNSIPCLHLQIDPKYHHNIRLYRDGESPHYKIKLESGPGIALGTKGIELAYSLSVQSLVRPWYYAGVICHRYQILKKKSAYNQSPCNKEVDQILVRRYSSWETRLNLNAQSVSRTGISWLSFLSCFSACHSLLLPCASTP